MVEQCCQMDARGFSLSAFSGLKQIIHVSTRERDARAIGVDVNCGLGTEGIAAAASNRPQLWTAGSPDATASFLSRNDSLAVLDRPTNATQVEEVPRWLGSRRCSSDRGRARSQSASSRAPAGATLLARHGARGAFCGCCRRSPQTGFQGPSSPRPVFPASSPSSPAG